MFVLSIAMTIGSPTVSTSSDVIVLDNPFYLEALGGFAIPDAFFAVLYFGTWAISVASVFVRFRRAGGVERQQIKWVAFGLLAAFIAIFLSDFVDDATLSAVVGGVGFLAFPISIGVAVLQFHLYDLDVVVKRTVVYAALALFATLVYLSVVVGVGAWLGRGDSLLTMIAAVIVAVSFQPVRAGFTKLADRLVYGRRATPYEVLADFAERVGDAYRDDDLLPRMARVLGEGVGAERADVWLKVDDDLRDVATWPADAETLGAVSLAGEDVPALEGADRVYRVEHAGELLGALAVRKPQSDPISPADDKLVSDLAAQAGLVLRNVRLTEELRARFDDLRAAQKRIVAAQDRERRRLERNIHDGAQQQLVALAVKARLARSLTDRDPAKAAEMLTQIEGETQEALEDLRDLARGIYPPLLADKGLAAALTAQARKSTVPVEVVADGVDRFPQEVEAAVYFSALEALQNTAKYADATRATVSLSRANGSLDVRRRRRRSWVRPRRDRLRYGPARHRRPPRRARRRARDHEPARVGHDGEGPLADRHGSARRGGDHEMTARTTAGRRASAGSSDGSWVSASRSWPSCSRRSCCARCARRAPTQPAEEVTTMISKGGEVDVDLDL